MSVRVCAVLLLTCALLIAGLAAEHQSPLDIPQVPQALLERAPDVRRGAGAVHDEVAAATPEAQQFYDQGLYYLHGHAWIEAARSLIQAVRLDPRLAPAHAALSLAYLEIDKPGESAAALAAAQRTAGGRSAHDQRHVSLRALQAAAEEAPADPVRLTAYRTAVDQAVSAFPADVEFLILRGLAASDNPAERGEGAPASALPDFDAAARLAPDHPGPFHYRAHMLDNGGQAQRALDDARAFVERAPEVAHAHHVLGLGLWRSGQAEAAIGAFEAADRLVRAYAAREKVGPSYDRDYADTLDLLAHCYEYAGRMARAETTFRTAFDLPTDLVAQLFNKRAWPVFLRGRGRLDDALAAARVLIAHPHPLVQATGHIETGFVLAARNSPPDAAAAFNTALRMLRGNPEGAPLAADAMLALQGELALRTAARDKGRATLGEVARRVRSRSGTVNWVQALFALDAMARLARQVGDWSLAGDMAEQMMAHDSSYAGSHFASALVLERAGDVDGARAAFGEAARRWSGADSNLPELKDARARGGLK